MLLRNRRLVLVLGGAFFISGGVFAAACGTDNGTTATPGADSGRDRDTTGEDAGEEEDSGDTPIGDGGGADCANAPKVRSGTGPYCFGVADGGGANCKADDGEICCSEGRNTDGGFGQSSCKKPGTAASGGGYNSGTCAFTGDGGLEFHCTESAHCPGSGEVCCGIGGTGGTPKPGYNNDFTNAKECNLFYQGGNTRFFGGTRCKSACEAGEIQICSSDAECKAGKCYPISLSGRYTGVCQVL